MKAWSVYLLRNERGALYTGISTDPARRLEEHRCGGGKGAKYTRACKTLEMVYCCEVGDRGLALKVESRIKKLPKLRKEALVDSSLDKEGLLSLFGFSEVK